MSLPFDYATIKAAWETYTPTRVRYGPDETGWAIRLDRAHVCLANVPMTDTLFLLDICECPQRGALPQVGRVVQRYYRQRAMVRYVPLDDPPPPRLVWSCWAWTSPRARTRTRTRTRTNHREGAPRRPHREETTMAIRVDTYRARSFWSSFSMTPRGDHDGQAR